MAFLLKSVSKGFRFIGLRRRGLSTSPPIIFSEEVLQAKSAGKPIVALESTIITHGMPFPHNLETAKHVENIIRQRGAVPATIAILKGQLTVGLTTNQLEYLAQAKGVVKASRRDLAPIIAAKLDGATTVAGTIIAAELADIPVFVTGGIGGVHRNGETTMDVSADLSELGRSRTLVVCSGVKSILDIGRTLEYLETQGVCVCAFGETHDFPAFYTRRSGHKAPHRTQDATEAARILHSSRSLGLNSGIVVAVPVPKEQAMDENVIEEAISKALEDARKNHINGKEVTPFILSGVAKATKGASLDTNIALIKNNAKVGADIAVEFNNVKNSHDSKNAFNISGKLSSRHFHTWSVNRARAEVLNKDNDDSPLYPTGANTGGDVLVIGGANVDRTYRTFENVQLDGSTHPCKMEQSGGGVGRNIAEALWRLRGGRARLLTAVGDDTDGRYLADIAPGLLLDGCIIKNSRTPTYAAVLGSKGECFVGLGDMALHNHITTDLVNRHIDELEQSPLVVMDGNLPQATIDYVLDTCHHMNKPVFFETTDRRKATKTLHSKKDIAYCSPNISELRIMARYISPDAFVKETMDLNEILHLTAIVSKYVGFLIVTIGDKGVVTVNNMSKSSNCLKKSLVAKYYPVKALTNVVNVSGAGDCFTGGFIHGMLSGYKESSCVYIGFKAAEQALFCKSTVPSDLYVHDKDGQSNYEVYSLN